MNTKVKQIESINLVKVLGILLIFNSHCDDLYPVSFLATGGAIGNTIFFILSGFFLKIQEHTTIVNLIKSRILQLYPGLFIATFFTMFLKRTIPSSALEWIKTLIYPTLYWFFWAIILFGVLTWFFQKKAIITDSFKWFSFIVIIIYFIAYAFVDKTRWSVEEIGITTPQGWFKMIHYFYAFALGFYIRSRREKGSKSMNQVLLIAICLLSFSMQIALKLVMVKMPSLYSIQFVCQFLDIIFALSALLYALSINEQYIHTVNDRFRNIINKLSKLSWETYLVQFGIIYIFMGTSFPMNILLAFVFSIVAALLLHFIVKNMRMTFFDRK